AFGYLDFPAVDLQLDQLVSVSRSFRGRRRLQVGRHRAGLVFDVMHELVAVVLQERAHRHRGGVAERADRASLDVAGDAVELVEVARRSLAVLDAVYDPPQPAGGFATRRALAAGFLEVEV